MHGPRMMYWRMQDCLHTTRIMFTVSFISALVVLELPGYNGLVPNNGPCTSSRECGVEGAVCQKYPECTTGSCTCLPGYMEHYAKCHKSRHVGEECGKEDLCVGATECREGVCECTGMNCATFRQEKLAHIIMEAEDNSDPMSCLSSYMCPVRAECRRGRCECLDFSHPYVITEKEYDNFIFELIFMNSTICVFSDVTTGLGPRAACDELHLCQTGLHCDRCSRQHRQPICVSAHVTYKKDEYIPEPQTGGASHIFFTASRLEAIFSLAISLILTHHISAMASR